MIPLPFAVFDEFGRSADDRVQDYAAACVAEERERCAQKCLSWGEARKPDRGGDALRNCAAAIRAGGDA
jgi:hypothetical protein